MVLDVLANKGIWAIRRKPGSTEGGNWKEAIGMITPSVYPSPPSTYHHHPTPSSTRLPVVVPPFLSSLLTFAKQTPVFQNYIPFWLRHGQSSRSIDTRELIRRWKKEERTERRKPTSNDSPPLYDGHVHSFRFVSCPLVYHPPPPPTYITVKSLLQPNIQPAGHPPQSCQK